MNWIIYRYVYVCERFDFRCPFRKSPHHTSIDHFNFKIYVCAQFTSNPIPISNLTDVQVPRELRENELWTEIAAGACCQECYLFLFHIVSWIDWGLVRPFACIRLVSNMWNVLWLCSTVKPHQPNWYYTQLNHNGDHNLNQNVR